jgi:hypothetical protein
MDAHSMHELRWWILPKWQPVTQTVGFENSTERSGRGAHRERDDQRVSLSRERFYCWLVGGDGGGVCGECGCDSATRDRSCSVNR